MAGCMDGDQSDNRLFSWSPCSAPPWQAVFLSDSLGYQTPGLTQVSLVLFWLWSRHILPSADTSSFPSRGGADLPHQGRSSCHTMVSQFSLWSLTLDVTWHACVWSDALPAFSTSLQDPRQGHVLYIQIHYTFIITMKSFPLGKGKSQVRP